MYQNFFKNEKVKNENVFPNKKLEQFFSSKRKMRTKFILYCNKKNEMVPFYFYNIMKNFMFVFLC